MNFFHILNSVIHSLMKAAAQSIVGLLTGLGSILAVVLVIGLVVATGCGLCGIGGLGLAARKRRKDS